MDNAISIVMQLLKLLKVPVTDSAVKQILTSHPDYPSLLSISDALKNWGIPNNAYQIGADDLMELPTPFIAHVRVEYGKFVIVKEVNAQSVLLINDLKKEVKVEKDNFLNVFTGQILIPERLANTGDPEYARSRRKEVLDSMRLPFVLGGIVLVLLGLIVFNTSYISDFTWQSGLITTFKITGTIISILLLIQSIDSDNPFIRKICTGKKASCTAILATRSAKVFGGELSWSEVGFFYFAGTLLLYLFNTSSVPLLMILTVLNILSLPYTVYSIYYQAIVAKKWCVLCCAVQVLLWLEFIPLLSYLSFNHGLPNMAEWSNLLLLFLIPILLWVFAKPFLTLAYQVKPLTEQLNEFKYNEALFHALLTNQHLYQLPEEPDCITFGSKDASRVITLVTNTFCKSCGEAHQTLARWLANGDDFQFQVVFAPNVQSDMLAKHFLSLKSNKETPVVSEAFRDWYKSENRDYSLWASKYPVNIEPDIESNIGRMAAWCAVIGLDHTPTILIDGYKLPRPYQLDDIRLFI